MQEIRIGSLLNRKDRAFAAELIADGGVAGVQNRGVNALWIDGSNPAAVHRLQEAKGEARQGRPVALTIGFDRLNGIVNLDVLAPEARAYLETAERLKGELGSLCFLRVPLTAAAARNVPSSSVSVDGTGKKWIQTWDPHGHRPTEDLIRLMQNRGVEYPAVTSMNISGQPELVRQDEGQQFCLERGIPLFLQDLKANPNLVGSYTIITLSGEGISLTRDGNVPGRVIEPIFNTKFALGETRAAAHPQMEFPDHLTAGLSSRGIRMSVLLYLSGKDPVQINERLRKNPHFTK